MVNDVTRATANERSTIMKRLITVLLVSGMIMLSGCTFRSMLHNPDLNRNVDCTAFGWGCIGAPMAKGMQESCESYWRNRGFKECDPCPPCPFLTPEERQKYLDEESGALNHGREQR